MPKGQRISSYSTYAKQQNGQLVNDLPQETVFFFFFRIFRPLKKACER